MNHTLEVFGEGQVTLENGKTHNVWVITNQQSEECAYVYDEVCADQLVKAYNAHEELVAALRMILDGNTMAGRENWSHADVIQEHYKIARKVLATIEKGA